MQNIGLEHKAPDDCYSEKAGREDEAEQERLGALFIAAVMEMAKSLNHTREYTKKHVDQDCDISDPFMYMMSEMTLRNASDEEIAKKMHSLFTRAVSKAIDDPD